MNSPIGTRAKPRIPRRRICSKLSNGRSFGSELCNDRQALRRLCIMLSMRCSCSSFRSGKKRCWLRPAECAINAEISQLNLQVPKHQHNRRTPREFQRRVKPYRRTVA